MADHMKAPLMFPCASRVKMPHVGSDETDFKQQQQHQSQDNLLLNPVLQPKPLPRGVSKAYVKQISSGFSFSEDVVRDRCFHALPYSDKYFLDALDVSDLIPPLPKSKILVGRHDARGSDKRHLPCHIKKRAAHKLKPVSKRKSPEKLQSPKQDPPSKDSTPRKTADPFFLTESSAPGSESKVSASAVTTEAEWDKYLLSILSQNTAEWIVKQRTSPGPYKHALETFVEGRYGPIPEEEPELVKDNISEVDFDAGKEGSSGKWRKGDETMLDKVREMTLAKGVPTDPYGDDNQAAFYRLPAGIRRAKKTQDKEEAGAINTTAYEIEVVPYKASPPKTLRDHLNPGVGRHIYESDNRFVQDWLTGAQQVHQQGEDGSQILLDNNNRYRKVYVEECPRGPDVWHPPASGTPRGSHSTHGGGGHSIKQQEKGLHRWKSLPQPIEDAAETFNVQAPGVDSVLENSRSNGMKKRSRNNDLLVQIVDDWRQKWHLDMRYADASPEDLVRDMADIHPHIRLKAITTCARAAEYRPPPAPGIQLDSEATQLDHVKLLPEVLFSALELCLDDDKLQVSRAAAVVLYTLERPIAKAEVILRASLQDKSSVDRWTATQCLAYFGECDSDVVSELIGQLLCTEDPVQHAQAATLLARLSENSTLVHSMIGEQLNSSSWRHRVMACQVLPKLNGRINRDLVNKLMHLMWTDWHTDVRKVAAQTLGKTGHGKRVHDELRERLLDSSERARVEATSRIGQLGIMTAKLLSVFLQCFDDSYVSVRMEACVACGNLRSHDDQVLERLVHAVTYDPIWKVKALALQALGEIGHVTKPVRDCVLWAFRYENKPGVRVQACHTIIRFRLVETEVAQILQDRYLVEKSDVVKHEITEALKMFGISPSADMDMVTQIKQEVHKLCTRSNICAQISLNEREEEREANVERMIYQPPASAKKERETPRYRPISKKLTTLTASEIIPQPGDPSRPLSRPFSQDTSVTDKEIMAIFDRYDDDDASFYTDKDDNHSRSSTAISEKSGGFHVGDPGVVSTPAETMSQPKSRVTFASPQADYEQIVEESEDGRPSDILEEPAKDEGTVKVEFGDTQTYVEVTGDPEGNGDATSDVVKVEHKTPVPVLELEGQAESVEVENNQNGQEATNELDHDDKDVDAIADATVNTVLAAVTLQGTDNIQRSSETKINANDGNLVENPESKVNAIETETQETTVNNDDIMSPGDETNSAIEDGQTQQEIGPTQEKEPVVAATDEPNQSTDETKDGKRECTETINSVLVSENDPKASVESTDARKHEEDEMTAGEQVEATPGPDVATDEPVMADEGAKDE